MIYPATIRIGAETYKCCRELGRMHGGAPAPHTHHKWERQIEGAPLTLSWQALVDVDGEQ